MKRNEVAEGEERFFFFFFLTSETDRALLCSCSDNVGTGESGKSTIAKQLKMIYQNGFNEDERRSYKDVIHSNVIIGMRSLVLAADRLGLEYASPEAKVPSFSLPLFP